MSDDTIYRQAAIDEIARWIGYIDEDMILRIQTGLKKVPSAQPEYWLDEWCTECKEYDHERHCCPRFNHVIRTTLQEVQAEQPGIIRCKDCKYWREDHTCKEHSLVSPMLANDFCSRAERRTDE